MPPTGTVRPPAASERMQRRVGIRARGPSVSDRSSPDNATRVFPERGVVLLLFRPLVGHHHRVSVVPFGSILPYAAGNRVCAVEFSFFKRALFLEGYREVE